MTSPTEQRRSFDTAMEHYRRSEFDRARAIFTEIAAASPLMSDAWLGRMACGDHSIDTLAAAHQHSRALYRETRRIGLADGTLHARPAAPMYLSLPAWSRATIALAYASALIAAERYDEAATLLDDPLITDDTQAAQWHQFVTATLHFKTRRWPDVRDVTAVSPPANATYTTEEVTAAVTALSASARAWGRSKPPCRSPNRSRQPTRCWPPTSH